MSFKINTNRKNNKYVHQLTKVESLAESIDNKAVKIQNNGNNFYYYKLSPDQNKSLGNVSSSEIVFDNEQNKWILIKYSN